MTTQNDLSQLANDAARLLGKADEPTTEFAATDKTSVTGWTVCALPSTESGCKRQLLVLSTEGTLHRLSETSDKTIIEEIPVAKAAEMTGQSLVALYMQVDSLLATLQLS